MIIRNNIANDLSIYNLDPNMTMDHNICLGINGKCQIITYVNGKADWGTVKPGIYRDHNIIDERRRQGMFVGFDPAKFVYDLRLRPRAIAIGAGNPEERPPVDITGAPRRVRSTLAPTNTPAEIGPAAAAWRRESCARRLAPVKVAAKAG